MPVIKWLKYLVNIGSLPDQPYNFESRRILLLNQIAIVAFFVTLAIVIIHLAIGNIFQPIVVSLGFLVAVPTLWFQNKRRYRLARGWFLIGFFLLIALIFFHSIHLRLDTATEYVLVILIPMTLIFLDGKKSILSTFLIILCGAAFIAYRYTLEVKENPKELYGLEINWFVISFGIFFCVVFFKRSLVYVNKVLEEDGERLALANKTKNFLFGIISHDIRSPLNTLKQYLHLDPSLREDPKQFMVYQEGLVKKVDEISNTLNDLLYWSKTQLQGIKSNPSLFHPKEVIYSILSILEGKITEKRIILNTNNHTSNPIWCDKDHLTVILRNLIQNAIKFTPHGGSLTLSTSDNLDFINIKVTDSGKGMDSDTLRNLKEGMIVESHLGTAGEVGTGLGLSLVKELIQKNQGQLEINSQLGEGTEITISFPKSIKKSEA